MSNDIEKSKMAKTIKEVKERIRKANSDKIFRNNQKAKNQRGY